MIGKLSLALLFVLLAISPANAVAPTPQQKLEACLRKADDMPDVAAADADKWLKQGGGEQARFCHASAQFNRNEFADAAEEFAALAKLHEKNDPRHAAELHARAGLTFTRADDHAGAEGEYAAALKLEPDDPEMWLDRATERTTTEHYWDAIADLNHALTIMPDMADALKLRGQAWIKLGNMKNAEVDFDQAAQIEAHDNPSSAPMQP